jgi:hypothetical protein
MGRAGDEGNLALQGEFVHHVHVNQSFHNNLQIFPVILSVSEGTPPSLQVSRTPSAQSASG